MKLVDIVKACCSRKIFFKNALLVLCYVGNEKNWKKIKVENPKKSNVEEYRKVENKSWCQKIKIFLKK